MDFDFFNDFNYFFNFFFYFRFPRNVQFSSRFFFIFPPDYNHLITTITITYLITSSHFPPQLGSQPTIQKRTNWRNNKMTSPSCPSLKYFLILLLRSIADFLCQLVLLSVDLFRIVNFAEKPGSFWKLFFSEHLEAFFVAGSSGL